ncbi:MAG: hypothetical protein Kow0069_31600 [Promethearchaeota archaeon]
MYFALIEFAIATFVVYQTSKRERVARPFLVGLATYFAVMGACNLLQALAYFRDAALVEATLDSRVGIYNDYWSVLAIYAAPLALIYQIKAAYFPDVRALGKRHAVTAVVGGLVTAFLAITLARAAVEPGYLQRFELSHYVAVTYVNWALIVGFICGAFLLLGKRTSGKFRTYAYVVFGGWSANQVINAVGQLLPLEVVLQYLALVFVVKHVGALVTTFGFLKLYSLR